MRALRHLPTAALAALALGACGAGAEAAEAVSRVPAPFTDARLFVDPESPAQRQVEAWRAGRPTDARRLEQVAGASQADWFGPWHADVRGAVDRRVTRIAEAGALPVLVVYAIPARDCGGYSAGGIGSPEGYRAWIRAFAEGLAGRRAAVVLEPDALAGLDCLSAGDRRTRLELLADAVDVLSADPGVLVYLDAGHSGWHPAGEMARRLTAAGVSRAQGFSLNVSNFRATAGEVAYGREVSALTGGGHFVVDTGRNGAGAPPDGAWCNPPGRRLGERPRHVADPVLDAFVWLKRPGESDGSCNGGPAAGQWWAEYALGLTAAVAPGGEQPAAPISGDEPWIAPSTGPSVTAPDLRAAPRFPAKLQVERARVRAGDRVLDVLAPISARASGEVQATFEAAGRTHAFSVDVDAGRRHVRFRERIDAAQARLGTGIVTLRYAGNDRTRPQEVRLRAAAQPARFETVRPAVADGRLRVRGAISDRARGLIRLRLLWQQGGEERSYGARARIARGRWSLDERLPADIAASLAARSGAVDSVVAFTGYLPARMRGEVHTFLVASAR